MQDVCQFSSILLANFGKLVHYLVLGVSCFLCSLPFSLLSTFLFALYLSLCSLPFSLLSTFLFALYLSLCSLPFSLLSTFLFALYLFLCSLPFSLLSTFLFVLYLSLCSLPFSLLSTFLFALYLSLCSLPFSLLSTFLFALYLSLCSLPFSLLFSYILGSVGSLPPPLTLPHSPHPPPLHSPLCSLSTTLTHSTTNHSLTCSLSQPLTHLLFTWNCWIVLYYKSQLRIYIVCMRYFEWDIIDATNYVIRTQLLFHEAPSLLPKVLNLRMHGFLS